jgi:hypothetical protein
MHVAEVIGAGGHQHGMLARHGWFPAGTPVRNICRSGVLGDNLPVQGPNLALSQQFPHGASHSPVTITWNGSPSLMPYLA